MLRHPTLDLLTSLAPLPLSPEHFRSHIINLLEAAKAGHQPPTTRPPPQGHQGRGPRATGHGLRATGYGLRATGHGPRATGHGLRATVPGKGSYGIRG